MTNSAISEQTRVPSPGGENITEWDIFPRIYIYPVLCVPSVRYAINSAAYAVDRAPEVL